MRFLGCRKMVSAKSDGKFCDTTARNEKAQITIITERIQAADWRGLRLSVRWKLKIVPIALL